MKFKSQEHMRPCVNLKIQFILLALFLVTFFVDAQSTLWDLTITHAAPCYVEVDSTHSPLSQYGFQLIRFQDSWYAIGDGTGLVYQKKSDGSWSRIDSTRFGGYHFGANLFEYNNNIIKYGGYGFWRNNGYFVKFENHTRQWEIIPTNVELPTNNKLLFFDKKNHTLFSFGNTRYNQVDSNESVYIDSLFSLDLNAMKWQNLGAISDKCIIDFHLLKRAELISNDRYCIFTGTAENYSPFCIDFKTLQFGELKLPLGISKLYDRINHPDDSTFCVTDGKFVYLINKQNYSILDQRLWSEIESNITANYPLIVYETTYLLWTTIFISAVIVIYLIIRGKRKRYKTTQNQFVQRYNELHFLSKNRIRFKGAIYQLNELDYRHLKLILEKKYFRQKISDVLNEINQQSKHLEITEQNIINWISRMNGFFTTIGMTQNLLQVQDDMIIWNIHINISFESR